jgi:hypothetical protein
VSITPPKLLTYFIILIPEADRAKPHNIRKSSVLSDVGEVGTEKHSILFSRFKLLTKSIDYGTFSEADSVTDTEVFPCLLQDL